jgi:hypothetical protein
VERLVHQELAAPVAAAVRLELVVLVAVEVLQELLDRQAQVEPAEPADHLAQAALMVHQAQVGQMGPVAPVAAMGQVAHQGLQAQAVLAEQVELLV